MPKRFAGATAPSNAIAPSSLAPLRGESAASSRRVRGLISVAALLSIAAFLPACSSARIAKENDRLREENQSLKTQVDSLTATNAELSAKLKELAEKPTAPMDADALAALPRVASIEVANLTGFYPGDREKPATSIHIYLRPLDGRQRFTQAVGAIAAEAFLFTDTVGIEEQSGAMPRAQLARRLSPIEVREAYRSGLTGTHYEIELPLDKPLKDRNVSILVRAEFTDALTGVTHKVEKLVKPPTPTKKADREAARK